MPQNDESVIVKNDNNDCSEHIAHQHDLTPVQTPGLGLNTAEDNVWQRRSVRNPLMSQHQADSAGQEPGHQHQTTHQSLQWFLSYDHLLLLILHHINVDVVSAGGQYLLGHVLITAADVSADDGGSHNTLCQSSISSAAHVGESVEPISIIRRRPTRLISCNHVSYTHSEMLEMFL